MKVITSIPPAATQAEKELEEFKRYIKEEFIKEIRVGIEKGHYPYTTAIQQNNSLASELKESLQKNKDLIGETLKIQENDLINERLNSSNLQKKLEDWQDFAIDFFQSMERIHEQLASSDKENKLDPEQLMLKILKDFEKLVSVRFGLERICPLKGEDVDKNFHAAKTEEESKDVGLGKILACQKWGYKLNGKLYKGNRAEVTIATQTLKQPSKD